MDRGEQRTNVEKKYDIIYRGLDEIASRIIAVNPNAPDAVYNQLKALFPGAWAVSTQSAKTIGGRELLAKIAAHNQAAMTWTQFGIAHSGTNVDFERAGDALLTRLMQQYAMTDCDLVLDLGCGWGHRMFDCWRAGIAHNARYFGGDRSDPSHRLVARIGQLFPSMQSGWFRFDFLNPTFAEIPEARRIAVYTFHAIEQVRRIGPLVFDRLFERFPDAEIVGIHCEPVTAQLRDDASQDRAYAEAKEYNIDLVSQISEHAQIATIDTQPAAIDAGSGNSTSVIIWRRR